MNRFKILRLNKGILGRVYLKLLDWMEEFREKLEFVPLYYRRFKYSPYKQWYWYLRLDLVNGFPHVQFVKHENKVWDFNILLKEVINYYEQIHMRSKG